MLDGMKIRVSLFALIFIFGLAPLATLHAGIFLKIEGIPGDSTVEGHAGEIEVQTFSVGVEQQGLVNFATGAGGGASKSRFKPLMVVKRVDSSSPLLFINCAMGTKLKSAVITLVNDLAESSEDFFKIVLTDVVIAAVSAKGDVEVSDSTLTLMENVEISYTKIEWVFTDPSGTVIRGGFDVKTNKRL